MRELLRGALSWRRWIQQRLWIAKIRIRGRLGHGVVDLEVSPEARVDPDVIVDALPGTRTRLVIGPRCRLEGGVVLKLGGGSVVLGPNVELRRNVVLNVAGDLRMDGDNILSWGSTVHVRESVVFEHRAACSEYITVTDSRHFHTTEDEFFYHNAEASPVVIGSNTWLASKCTVLMGTRIGSNVVVGGSSIVRGEVPDGVVVAGAPAAVVRPSLPQRR